jgi:hypothetical protein
VAQAGNEPRVTTTSRLSTSIRNSPRIPVGDAKHTAESNFAALYWVTKRLYNIMVLTKGVVTHQYGWAVIIHAFARSAEAVSLVFPCLA